MPLPHEFLDLLCCPETGQSLSLDNDQLIANDVSYPLLDGIPWLISHPRNSLLDWGSKLNFFQQTLLKEISELEVERKKNNAVIHGRIETLLTAKKDFLLQITTLLEPMTRAKVASIGSYSALLDRAPTTQNLLSYEANIYRDWQWGSEENTLTKELVLEYAPENFGKFCVLGAGSCRLAFDLHTEAQPELTVATDINPLFLFAVKKIFSGESFSLTEFPLQPKNSDCIAIKHKIQALESSPENFHLCFSDSIKPPFIKHSFDTVLTPWLIDIQPYELSCFLNTLNQYLPIGGCWLNFGSLVFSQARDALCYTNKEITELALQSGFEITKMNLHEIPYLKSPYNAGYRVENIWAWQAVKRRHIKAEENIQLLPNWLIDINETIPKEAYIIELKSQSDFLSKVLAKVNGRNSIRTLARDLARENNGDEHEFQHLLVQYFLQKKQFS